MDGPKVMNSMQQQQQDVIKASWAYREGWANKALRLF
jgi:hypothetical protein